MEPIVQMSDQDVQVYTAATIIPESAHPIREQHIDREALKVLYRLRDAGFKGYLVGGGVRDLYLGKIPKDFDISTDARPGQLRRMFRNSRTIGRRFRLVQVFFRGNKIIEVSTLRSRSEYDIDSDDQVLPSNNTFGTLEEDAFRRDLTINALFYEIEQHTIIDYTGGVADLKQGIIRVVGEPARRFTRDPVRMLRVVRHAARTNFEIEKRVFTALSENSEKLRLCPPSRVRDEILKDLQSGCCRSWAELCMTSGLWPVLFPLYTFGQMENGEQVRQQLLDVFSVLDRLHSYREDAEILKVPDSILFACLLLPWACHRYNLPEVNVRGQGFHRLSRTIRDEIDHVFGEPFNMQRMVKEMITTLLVNLSTFHHARKQGDDPKWLKKKSYYRDCSRFFDIYQESRGIGLVKVEQFIPDKPKTQSAIDALPVQQEPSGGGRSRGRGGMSPAFSQARGGVFGLHRAKR